MPKNKVLKNLTRKGCQVYYKMEKTLTVKISLNNKNCFLGKTVFQTNQRCRNQERAQNQIKRKWKVLNHFQVK